MATRALSSATINCLAELIDTHIDEAPTAAAREGLAILSHVFHSASIMCGGSTAKLIQITVDPDLHNN